MDGLTEELQKTLNEAAYRLTLVTQREHLRIRAEKNLTIAKNGGSFRITPELINFIKIWISENRDEVILLDMNNNPIKITDIQTFYEELLERYAEVMNDWFVAYETLKKQRSVTKIVENS